MSAAVSLPLDPNAPLPAPKKNWKGKREPETPQTIRRGTRDMLHPIREPATKRRYVVFDLESKKLDTQDPGFERPFLGCFWDGFTYETFRDDPRHKGRSYTERYWHEPGGNIDKLMRHIVGLRECEECEIGPEDYKWGGCSECIARRRKYQGKDTLIVSHNGGNFDNLYALGWYRRHSELFEECEIINVQSRMLILTFRPKGAPKQRKSEKYTFTDSIALIPKSLKEIGEAFCAGDEDFQKMKFNLNLHEDDPLWDQYNYRDCAVLLKSLDKFRKLVEKLGGAVSITAAGTSMQLLLRKFLKKPVYRNSHFEGCDGYCRDEFCQIEECREKPVSERACHGCMHDFVREAYHGGRTEIFRKFGYNLTYSDVNSSYPTSMKADLPVGRAREINGPSLSMMKTLAKQRIGFVECVIEIPRKNNYLPPLPYRLIKGPGQMKLIFPVGRLYGVWDWIELELALAAGARIIDVGRTVWFEKGKLFDKMITVLYGYRNKICKVCGLNVKKGKCQCAVKTWDPALDELAKLMMNSGYGKLATKQIREMTLFADYVPEGAIVPPPWVKNAPFRKQHYLRADYIIPHIAAHITADARKRMYLGLMSVRKNGGYIVYGDTDSGIASLPIMPQGDELGQWKVEDDNFSVETLLPKTYKLKLHSKSCKDQRSCPGCRVMHKDDCGDKACEGCLHMKSCKDESCLGCAAPIKVAMKGVPKGMQTVEVFDHLARGSGQMVRDEKTGRMNVVFGSEVDSNGKRRPGSAVFLRLTKYRTMLVSNLDSPIEEEAFRSIQSEYDKRRWLPDGDTEPLMVLDPMTVAEGREKHQALLRGDYERWRKRMLRDKQKEKDRLARAAGAAVAA